MNQKNNIFLYKAPVGKIKQYFIGIYDITRFILRILKEIALPPYEFREIIRQCYYIGYKSAALVSVTGFIIGVVFTKQSRPSLADLGAISWLPSLVSVAIIRALAPLITALIAAGKVGSNIGAELGSMKVSEQIDAMEVSRTNPFKFLVVSRVVASTIMIPALTMYNGLMALFGSFLNLNANESVNLSSYLHDAFSNINFIDIYASLVRAVVYGFTIGVTGCYKGYNTTQGTQGIGKAANSAVVASMFLIFIEEMIIVQIVSTIRKG